MTQSGLPPGDERQVQLEVIELADAQRRPADRGVDGVGAAAVAHASVDQGLLDADLATDEGDDLLDHLLEVRLVAEAGGRRQQAATSLDVDLVPAVDEDVGNIWIVHVLLQRSEPDQLVHQRRHRPFVVGPGIGA